MMFFGFCFDKATAAPVQDTNYPKVREPVLPVTKEQNETDYQIHLEGTVNLSSAEELKGLLIEGFASQRNLRLNLSNLQETDITVMQLLWAAEREAERLGVNISGSVSDMAKAAASDVGFARFPAIAVQE